MLVYSRLVSNLFEIIIMLNLFTIEIGSLSYSNAFSG